MLGKVMNKMIAGKKPNGKDDYRTPDWLFDLLNARFNFEVDAAASSDNHKCNNFFDEEHSGLDRDWGAARVFCNPPFSEKDKWIKKAYMEVRKGDCPLCVMILPLGCMDTKVFNRYIHRKYYYEHLPFRVSFCDENGKPIQGNPTGSLVIYFWKDITRP